MCFKLGANVLGSVMKLEPASAEMKASAERPTRRCCARTRNAQRAYSRPAGTVPSGAGAFSAAALRAAQCGTGVGMLAVDPDRAGSYPAESSR